MDSTQVTLHGNSVNLQEYVKAWSEKLCADDVLKFPTQKLPEGEYERSAVGERHFEPGCILIETSEIERAVMSIRYLVRVLRPSVISSFEVASRGRHLQLEPVQLHDGATMQMNIAIVPN